MVAQQDAVFKVLADGSRRKMVKLLGKKERTVGELERSLKLSQSSTSQHLKLLAESGLVTYRKHGNFRYYSLRIEPLRKAMSFFDNLWDDGLIRMKRKLERRNGK